jgi:hypothetical protein
MILCKGSPKSVLQKSIEMEIPSKENFKVIHSLFCFQLNDFLEPKIWGLTSDVPQLFGVDVNRDSIRVRRKIFGIHPPFNISTS